MSDQFGTISISPDQPEKPSNAEPRQRPRRRPGRKSRPEKERPSRKKPPAAPRGKGWLLRYLLPCIVVIPLCYTLAGFWLVPAYMKKSLPERIADRTGMHLFISALDFNPFTFTFTLQDIQLQPSRTIDGNKELLRIERVVADLAPISLLRHDLVSNAVAVEGLALNIVRTHDNRYNVEDIFTIRQQGEASDIISFSELPFLFSLNNISIREGRVTFQDIPSATTHTLDQIELDLPSLSNFPFETNQYIHPRFSAVFNGSKIELTGQAAIAGGPGDEANETKLSCNIQDLDLPLYFNYLPVQPPFSLAKGKAAGKLEISFSRGTKEKEARLSLDFTGRISELGLVGANSGYEAAIPEAILEGSLTPLDRRLHVRKLTIAGPVLKSRSPNLTALLPSLLSQAGKKPSAGTPPERAGVVDVDQLEITDGTIELAGKGKAKPQSWTSLQASVKGYSWTTSHPPAEKSGGSFHISGENADPGTVFDWQGSFSDQTNMAGPVRIDNIPAATFLEAIGLKPQSVHSGSANLQGKLLLSARAAEAAGQAIGFTDTDVTLRDLKLAAENDPWLEAPSLKLTGLSKNDTQVHLGALHVENGAVSLRAGTLPEPIQALAAKDSRLTLDAIDFTGSINIGGSKTAPLKLTSVLLQAKSLNSDEKTDDTVLFSAKINDKGAIKAKGSARLAPFSASLNTGFSGIEASVLLPWFSSRPVIAGARAAVSGKGVLSLPGVSYTGELHLDDAVFKSADKELLKWKGCEIQGLSYARSPFRLGIDRMAIDSPAMAWQRSSAERHPAVQFGNFLRQLLSAGERGHKHGDSKGELLPIDIKAISITGGEMAYRDTRSDPPWSTGIDTISGSITDIRSRDAAGPSRFSITGRIAQLPFTLTGTADLLGSNPSGDASLQVSGMPLAAFGKNLPPDLGLDTRQGSLTATSTASWKDGRLTEQTQFVLSDLRSVSLESDAALPIALLKNGEGKVALNVRHERDLATDSIPLLQQTVTTFRRQVIKAKVSPILLTGGDFADLVGNEFLEFQPAEFDLTENGRKTLTRFASFLKAHPHVGLRIIGAADRVIDGEAINTQLEQLEAQRIAEENARRKAAWQRERELELERRRAQVDTSQGFIEEDLMADFPEFIPLKPAPVAFQDAMLEDLARNRAKLVQRLLAEQLARESARMTIAKELRITGDANSPGNRALLELQIWEPPETAGAAEPENQKQ